MDSETEIKKSVLKTLVSENQAIGIYEAEVFWKKYPQETFRAILRDETRHAAGVKRFIKNNAWACSWLTRIKMDMNLASGWMLGTLLSLVPRKTCFWLHAVAEKKAAEEYKSLMEKLEQTTGMESERDTHFRGLLKTMMNNEAIHSEIFRCHYSSYN